MIMKKILEILNQYRKRKAKYTLIKELFFLASILFSLLIIIIFFEYIFYIEILLRSKLMIFIISISGILVSYTIIKHFIIYFALFNYENNDSIAQELGEKDNAIKDQLLNVIQINNSNESNNSDLKEIATQSVYNKLYNKELPIAYPKKIIQIFFLIFISLILLLLNPNLKKSAYRLIHYDKKFNPPYPFTLTSLSNNLTVLSGDTIKINIAGTGDVPDSIDFYWVENNKTNVKKIAHNKEIYSNTFNNINSEIIYWAELKSKKIFTSWNTIQTNNDTINIKNRPRIKTIEFKINPPEYTNITPYFESFTNINQTNIVKGSIISINGETTKNLSSGWILNKNNNQRLDIQIENNLFNKEITLNEDLLFSIYYLDEEFIPNLNPKQYYFIVDKDKIPNISIQKPNIEFNIDESMFIPIICNIADDFGLSEIFIQYEIISEDFPDLNKPVSKFLINNTLNTKTYNLNMNWDIKKLPISMGDELHFKIGAIDNNVVDGKQIGLSNAIIGRFPSLENLFLEIENLEDDTADILDNIENSIEEISDLSEDIRKELLKSENTTWEQEQQLENSFEEINEIASEIEQIQENINNILDKAENNQLFDNELMDKFEKFQDLISDIISDELLDSIKKLQDAMESLNIDDITKALENFNFNVEQFEEQLDRYIEMFESAMIEQKLNELSEHMENMIDKQIDFIEDVKNNQDEYVLERKGMKQENRFSEFKELLNESSKIIESESEDTSKQLSDLLNDTKTQTTENLLSQQTANTFNKNNSNQIKKNLEDIKDIVNNINQSFQNELNQKLTKEFIIIINSLITISNQQEELILESKNLRSNSPNIQQINRKQYNIDRQFNQITKQLINLSNMTFFVNPKINRLIGKLKSTISNIISNFEQKNISKAKQSQKISLQKINEITYLLLLSMDEMQSSNSVSGFEKFMESLEQMSQSQEGINQGTMQLGQMGMMQQQSLIQQLMQQQSALRQQLSELISNNPGENTGGLAKAKEEMEKVISDFELNNITTKTIERQQSILSKMLDSQKSLKQRDFSNKRNSKTAENKFDNINYNDIPDNYGEKDLFYISAMENALKNNSNKDYDNIIRLYFLNLQKESIQSER